MPSADDDFLERTLPSSFVPGTNRKGDVLGGAWTLLLDSLELGHVVCLGTPTPRTLRTLVRRGRGVTIVCEGNRERRWAHTSIAQAKTPEVEVIDAAGAAALGDVDLAVVTSNRWADRADQDPVLRAVLRRAGSIFADMGISKGCALFKAAAARMLWLGAEGCEVHMAAGLDDDATIALLRRPASAMTSAKGRARALLGRMPAPDSIEERRAMISIRDGSGTAPPVYLREIAAAAGVDIGDCRVGLVAAPDYPSRKAILFLLPGAAQTPRYVVKMPRDGAFNSRLENEWRALSLLAGAGIGDDATVPRPAFFGYHAGLAVLGQTVITGVPFRQRTDGTAACPLAWRGVTWLDDLAAATADATVTSNDTIAAGLHRLLARYAEIYRPVEAERALLAGLIDRVSCCPRPMPLVFTHGDAGTWNLLISPDGRPAFLDWEAAESRGLPLWDLFYFMRSLGVGVAGATGRNSLKGFADQFLVETPLSRSLAELVERHCERIGLAPELAEPLFFTCWMHRALKESMRLGPSQLDGGRYVRLLRLCLEHRDAPTLRRVFGRA